MPHRNAIVLVVGSTLIVPANSTRTFRAPGRVGDYGFHCRYPSTRHATLRVRR